MSSQATLSGNTADERVRPDTFRYCNHCERDVLRSRWSVHADHHTPVEDEGDDEDDEPDPMQVGAKYRVRHDVAVTYDTVVCAGSEHEAKEKASEQIEYGTAVDADHVHDEVIELEPVYEDDPEAEEHGLRP